MLVAPRRLRRLAQEALTAAGCSQEESSCAADHLVDANLSGHDSHGVVRLPMYVQWLLDGTLTPRQELETVVDSDCFAIVDGGAGLGQPLAAKAVRLALEKVAAHGVSIIGLRNAGHVGRVGHWVEMAAEAGKIGLCFVNTSGRGNLVAPFGGIERRLSANPIAVGVPVKGASPIVVDVSTCVIAEGKVRVAFNRGEKVRAGAMIDAAGEPTVDPAEFYTDPPGALLPIGGHKGFALGVVVEILAGALTGGSCTRPGTTIFRQSMLTILIDPYRFQSEGAFSSEIKDFIASVKSSRPSTENGEVLMPGEPEERTRAQRRERGIEIDQRTWEQIVSAAQSVGMSAAEIEATSGS